VELEVIDGTNSHNDRMWHSYYAFHFFLVDSQKWLLFLSFFFTLIWLVDDLNVVAQFAAYFLGVSIFLFIAVVFDEVTENLFKRPNGIK